MDEYPRVRKWPIATDLAVLAKVSSRRQSRHDLLGFTGLTEHLSPDALIAMLDLFFDAVTKPAASVGGGHVGDAVLFFCISSATPEPVARPLLKQASWGFQGPGLKTTARTSYFKPGDFLGLCDGSPAQPTQLIRTELGSDYFEIVTGLAT
jgi:hypothetical protein